MIIHLKGLKNKAQEKKLLIFSKKICRFYPPFRAKGETWIIFVSDPQIKKINRDFLNHDRPTDVIAFPYQEGRQSPFESLTPASDQAFGDIYISTDTARRQAGKNGYPLVRELALLLLHGLLHLTGFEDGTAAQKKRMFREQSRLFEKVEPGLAPPV